MIVTQEQLRRELAYVPETGSFVWTRTRGGAHKGAKAGSIHRSTRSKTKYVRIELFRQHYFAHNLAWFWVYGRWPETKLDHIDRNGLNNRIENLREATASQNKFNTGLRVDNSSGYTGVYLQDGRWRAEVRCNGKKIFCGLFDNKEQAVLARRSKAQELFGEFSNVE